MRRNEFDRTPWKPTSKSQLLQNNALVDSSKVENLASTRVVGDSIFAAVAASAKDLISV